ncbi:hypothetical protein O181_040063 [Austropuccinia psidii MF-1]|uniref:Uncharacterized protein n=1 Tax=Austropuccinia psidii MF-1 TaxID=1389203 RepID=A0A9Q3HCI3_9BASI|nr:hypothetical protein [Austropuccinia psidii MF-1]
MDQLTSHPSRIDPFQYLMETTLMLDTGYHERQKEKKPEALKSVSSHPQNSSSSPQKKKNFHSQKLEKPHSSLMNKDFKLMSSEIERRLKESLCAYCDGKSIVLRLVSKFLKTSLPNH